MIARANYAVALVAGPDTGRLAPYDPAALAKKHGHGTDTDALLTFHHRLLFGIDPPAEVRRRMSGADGAKVVAMLLSSPEGQLA